MLLFILFINILPILECYKPPPPPPPPPLPSSSYNDWNTNNKPPLSSSSTTTMNYKDAMPIHYSFDKEESQSRDENTPTNSNEKITLYNKYTSTLSSRIHLSIYTSIFASILSIFLTKSISFLPKYATILSITSFYFICTILKPKYTNVYITFIQSLGIVLHQSMIQYHRNVRKNGKYKTWPYILYILSLKREKPPDVVYKENEKVGCMIGIFFLGAIFGGSIPYIPTSISGTVTAFFFLYFCTNQSPRGDLFRLISIRLYTFLIKILWSTWNELDMSRNVKNILESVMHLCFILDRKHRIYDKVVSVCSFIYYNMIMKIWNSVSNKDGDGGERGDGGRRRYDDDRERRNVGRNEDDRRRVDDGRSRRNVDERQRHDRKNDGDARQDYDRSVMDDRYYNEKQRNSVDYQSEPKRRLEDDDYYPKNKERSREERNSEENYDIKETKSSFWKVLGKK